MPGGFAPLEFTTCSSGIISTDDLLAVASDGAGIPQELKEAAERAASFRG